MFCAGLAAAGEVEAVARLLSHFPPQPRDMETTARPDHRCEAFSFLPPSFALLVYGWYQCCGFGSGRICFIFCRIRGLPIRIRTQSISIRCKTKLNFSP
jgi:hypothetical protein